jgi:protein ImuA
MRATPEILQDLATRIRAMQSSAGPPSPAENATVLPFLDMLLKPAALGAGSLVELLAAADGAGAWTLALYWARHACVERKALVLVDARGWFYPPGAAALGLDLEHVILVRPTSRSDCQAALDQALRCTAVGAVVGWCDRLIAAEAQRLKLAAEAGNGLGLILRPLGAARGPSFADLRLRVAPHVWTETARRVHIEVVRWRGGKEGQTLIVEIDDETGDVRVPPGLAAAAARA